MSRVSRQNCFIVRSSARSDKSNPAASKASMAFGPRDLEVEEQMLCTTDVHCMERKERWILEVVLDHLTPGIESDTQHLLQNIIWG